MIQLHELLQEAEKLDDLILQCNARAVQEGIDVSADIAGLETRRDTLLEQALSTASPADIVRMARDPYRPQTLDYIAHWCGKNFIETHGDRRSGDDRSIITGFGKIMGRSVVIIGNQKGRNAKERGHHNMGCGRPAAYLKALRMMEVAEEVGAPVICLIDTVGADITVSSEAGGISQVLAECIQRMSLLRTRTIATIIGEGGSGGAIALGVADRVLMLRHAYYSVIAPPSCAKIIWRDEKKEDEAAKALKLTAVDALELGVIDEIVPEPPSGARRNPSLAAEMLGNAIAHHLDNLAQVRTDELISSRIRRFQNMGRWAE